MHRAGFFVGFSGLVLVACKQEPIATTSENTPMSEAAVRHEDSRLAAAMAAPLTPITEERARALAVAFVADFGAQFQPYWERRRGKKVTLSSLRPAERALYASSRYGAGADLPTYVRKEYGAWYIVHFYEGDEPAVKVAVSALNSDIAIIDGHLRFPLLRGSDFFSTGTPVSTLAKQAASAEAASELVSNTLDADVKEGATFILPPRPSAPTQAFWKVELTRSVRVATERDQPAVLTREVYVDHTGRVSVSTASDGSSSKVSYARVTSRGLLSATALVPVVKQPTRLQPIDLY